MKANQPAGPATPDPARARALFHYPKVAFKRPLAKIEPHAFTRERDLAFATDAPSGFVVLDRSAALGLPWQATLPTILARYLVLRKGERFQHTLKSTGETYYAATGAGRSENGDDPILWQAGDAFCLAGGRETRHTAGADSVLFLATNEPELRYARAEPSRDLQVGIRPTLFSGTDVSGQLAAIAADPSPEAAGRVVILVTAAMRERIAATPTLSLSVNSLQPGADQQPHRHSSAALTLCIAGDAVHSRVDGLRLDWSPGLVFLTPPCAVHSHHNRGATEMRSFVVQDSPLHAQMRTTSFQFVAPPAAAP